MKKIIFIGTIVVLLLIINGIARSIYDLWKKQDLLLTAQKTLEREKEKNQKLKRELEKVQTKEFIEEEARNKLFLVKEGEQQVVFQKPAKKEEKKPSLPNWKKWLDLFF